MPSLHELQRQFATAIVTGDPQIAVASIIDDAPGAAARLAIYSNHFRVTLIDALAATFPVVQELVGEPFTARTPLRREGPARGPCCRYGRCAPRSSRHCWGTAALPYLGGIARLEWAIHPAAW
ncbi:MAG: DNA-binding domain-containing protein [Rhodospirillales bacterium]